MTHDPRGPDTERPHIWFKGGMWCFRWAQRKTASRTPSQVIQRRNSAANEYTLKQFLKERNAKQDTEAGAADGSCVS